MISIWIQIWICIQSFDLHPHFVISIWIETWICIQSMDLHGHSTLCNIHMDTNMDIYMEYSSADMDMDMQCGSTRSVEILYIPSYPY